MEITQDHPVIAMVVDKDCKECDFMLPLVDETVRENATTGVTMTSFDVWDEPEAIVELEATTHPTVILFVGGHERVRIAGSATKRQLLRKLLPYLHADPDTALGELRRQLDNPGETLPAHRRPLLGSRNTDKIALLRDVPIFSAMSKRRLAMVARYADETAGVAGQFLATEGDIGDQLFLICEGSAVVRKQGEEIAKLGPGDCFGEMALIDGEARSASVELLEDSQLLAIHRRDFDFMMKQVPDIAREMLVVLSRRLREADEKLVG